jgi:hypothetical protein
MKVHYEGSNSMNKIGHNHFYIGYSQSYDISTVRCYVTYVNEGAF